MRVENFVDQLSECLYSFMKNMQGNIEQIGHSGWNLFLLAQPHVMLHSPKSPIELPDIRITLDTPEDLEVLRKLAPDFVRCGTYTVEGWRTWLTFLQTLPEEFWTNSHIKAKKAGEG